MSEVAHYMAELGTWLGALDDAKLECDGMSRAIATLLSREAIPHRMMIGSLTVTPARKVTPHFWIALNDGYVCDFRARMWLGTDGAVPHGVFLPNATQHYEVMTESADARLSPGLFEVLTGTSLSQSPRFRSGR